MKLPFLQSFTLDLINEYGFTACISVKRENNFYVYEWTNAPEAVRKTVCSVKINSKTKLRTIELIKCIDTLVALSITENMVEIV